MCKLPQSRGGACFCTRGAMQDYAVITFSRVGKNRAVLSSHRDSLLAKVPGLCPDASSSNAYEIIPPGR